MQRFGVAARLLVGFHDAVDCTVHANQSRRIGRDDLGRVANNVLIWSALALIRNQWVGSTNPGAESDASSASVFADSAALASGTELNFPADGVGSRRV